MFFLSQKNNNASNVNPTPTPTPTESVQSTVPLTNTPTPIPHVHSFDSDYVCTSCGESGHTEGLEYKLNDAETYYIVTGIGSASGKEVIIPSEHKGLPVREIADYAFKNLSKLTKVVIPKTIKKIGTSAFAGSKNLSIIEFNAIECDDCSGGTFDSSGQDSNGISLTFGNDVTRIPANLFNQSQYNDLYAKVTSVTFKGEKVTEIGIYAFYECKKLSSITLPKGLKTIKAYAFSQCTSLTSVFFEEPYTWYAGSTLVAEFGDPQTAATALTSTYVGSNLKKE